MTALDSALSDAAAEIAAFRAECDALESQNNSLRARAHRTLVSVAKTAAHIQVRRLKLDEISARLDRLVSESTARRL
jgi:chromosome segregation ATPase